MISLSKCLFINVYLSVISKLTLFTWNVMKEITHITIVDISNRTTRAFHVFVTSNWTMLSLFGSSMFSVSTFSMNLTGRSRKRCIILIQKVTVTFFKFFSSHLLFFIFESWILFSFFQVLLNLATRFKLLKLVIFLSSYEIWKVTCEFITFDNRR